MPLPFHNHHHHEGPGPSAPSGVTDEGLFKVFTELNDLSVKFGVELPLPKIAVAGIQSAGKTTLIESYLSRPLGLACEETGTRCPVSYTLMFDRNVEVGTLQFEIDGIPHDERCAHTAIEQHMARIKDSPREFTSQELKVVIRGANLPNILIVDLPGLLPGEAPRAGAGPDPTRSETIDQITAGYLRDPSFHVIVVVKCTESVSTMMEKSMLTRLATEIRHSREPDREWAKRCIMVVNKCDTVFNGIYKTDAANKMFEPVINNFPIHYFVAMKPSVFIRGANGMTGTQHSTFDRATATFEEICAYYKSLEESEENYFGDWIRRLDQPLKWNMRNESYIGLKNAKLGIHQLWLQALSKAYPEVMRKLTSRIKSCEQDLRIVEDKLKVDKGPLSASFDRYIEKFLEQIKRIQVGKPRSSTLMDDDSNVPVAVYPSETISNFQHIAVGPGSNKKFNPADFGRTYKQDVEQFEALVRNFYFYISPEDLASDRHLGVPNQGLGEELTMRQVALGGIRRLAKCLSYMMLAYTTKLGSTKEEMLALGQRVTGNHYDGHEAVQNLARNHLLQNGSVMEWFCECAMEIYSRHTDLVHEFLWSRDGLTIFGEHNMVSVVHAVTQAYKEAVSELCLNPLKKSFKEDCRKLAFYIPMDTVSTDIIASCMCRVDATLHHPSTYRSSAWRTAGVAAPALQQMTMMDEETSAGDDGDPMVHSVVDRAWYGSGWRGPKRGNHGEKQQHPQQRGGLYFDADRKDDASPVNPHTQNKITAILQLCGELQLHTRLFNVADLVEGGLEEVLPQLPYDMDPQRDIKIAQQLYFSSTRHLEQSFRRSVEYYLIRRMEEDPDREIEKLIKKKLQDFTGEKLLNILMPDMELLKRRKSYLEEELAKLQAIIPQAQLLLKQLRQDNQWMREGDALSA
ncbi:hypothetical protein DFJ73DRAFT_798600 [Zopfochytrium polystomum]|nr:hypothetical protein DFJ73DRAFT_798600 [Zopfochytrium polystomum]